MANHRRSSSYGSTLSSINPASGPGSPLRTLRRPSRKRASKPKVRTGCINCKQRHLKCDERKPYCSRCQDFGIPCHGYASIEVGTGDQCIPNRRQRALLPRPQPLPSIEITATLPITPLSVKAEEQPDVNVGTADTPIGVISRSPKLIPELDDDDAQYLSFFLLRVVGQLSPHYPSRFWSSISLRESSSNRCILHAVLSIGAYSRAVEEVRQEAGAQHETHAAASTPAHYVRRSPWFDARRNRHHGAALAHYSKAIRLLRGNLSMRADSHIAIVANLLFVAFENMQGNYHAAGNLVRSGIKVLGGSMLRGATDRVIFYPTFNCDHSPFPRHSPSASMSRKEPLQSPPHRFSSRQSQFPRPAPAAAFSFQRFLDTKDGEITEMMQMYTRLSTASLFLPFPHCKSAYYMLIDTQPSTVKTSRLSLGKDLASMDQARATWDFYLPGLATFLHKCAWHILNSVYEFDFLGARSEQNAHLAWLSSFGAALESLERTYAPHTDEDLSEYSSGMTLLALQHMGATIFTSCCLDPSEVTYDAYIDVFRSIISRCRALVPGIAGDCRTTHGMSCFKDHKILRSGQGLSFANDAGLLPLLGFVACKCRDWALRQQVLSLLECSDWREGSWDSRSLSIAIRALMQLENKDRKSITGTVPPSARFAWTNASFDLTRKSLHLEFTRLLPGENGENEKTELQVQVWV